MNSNYVHSHKGNSDWQVYQYMNAIDHSCEKKHD